MKVGPLGAKLSPTDGRMDRWTDVAKLTVDFCNFANASKILSVLCCGYVLSDKLSVFWYLYQPVYASSKEMLTRKLLILY
jgi:hypothetical protein